MALDLTAGRAVRVRGLLFPVRLHPCSRWVVSGVLAFRWFVLTTSVYRLFFLDNPSRSLGCFSQAFCCFCF